MIEFISKDFKDIKIGSKQVVKVYQGIDVVWEKATIKTISWTTSSQVSPFAKTIDIPDSYQSELKDKQLLFVKIGELQKVPKVYIKVVFPTDDRFKPHISFSKSLDEILGVSDWIYAGTQITVTYK